MQQLIGFKNKEVKYIRILQDLKKINIKKIYFVFFQNDQLGIGPHEKKWREIGQKLDFKALSSEI